MISWRHNTALLTQAKITIAANSWGNKPILRIGRYNIQVGFRKQQENEINFHRSFSVCWHCSKNNRSTTVGAADYNDLVVAQGSAEQLFGQWKRFCAACRKTLLVKMSVQLFSAGIIFSTVHRKSAGSLSAQLYRILGWMQAKTNTNIAVQSRKWRSAKLDEQEKPSTDSTAVVNASTTRFITGYKSIDNSIPEPYNQCCLSNWRRYISFMYGALGYSVCRAIDLTTPGVRKLRPEYSNWRSPTPVVVAFVNLQWTSQELKFGDCDRFGLKPQTRTASRIRDVFRKVKCGFFILLTIVFWSTRALRQYRND